MKMIRPNNLMLSLALILLCIGLANGATQTNAVARGGSTPAPMKTNIETIKKANPVAPGYSADLPETVWSRLSRFDAKSKTARDPFFPNSARHGFRPGGPTNSVAIPVAVAAVVKPEDLVVVEAIFGSGEERTASINGRFLTAGEEAYVETGAGAVKVKCLEISEKTVVLILNDGPQKRELRLR